MNGYASVTGNLMYHQEGPMIAYPGCFALPIYRPLNEIMTQLLMKDNKPNSIAVY